MPQGEDPLIIAPGVRRLRPDDHFMILTETDASPMHIGALLLLEVPEEQKPQLADKWRSQLSERLPGTPLQVRLAQCPDGYDSDVWVECAGIDLDKHVTHVPARFDDDAALYAAIAKTNMERLDLSEPPFSSHVFSGLPGARAAIYFKVHHSVADGIGFQELLRLLSDEAPAQPERSEDAKLPDAETWHALAEERFASEEPIRAQQSERRKTALETIKKMAGQRAETPMLKMSGPTSTNRNYTTISLAVDRFKATAKFHGATVNDLFFACASTALRNYLIEIGDLPEAPIVVNSARSYRRPEHGSYGNRIVALHPHLATHLADPIERLRAIQESMAAEMRRTPYDEAMLDALEKPYGARDRREAFAKRVTGGGRVLPGNITLSNVPGPSAERRFAGYRQIHNFPVPIIGSGRFLNITSRRSGPNLDMGLIVDAEKIGDVDSIASNFVAAFETYDHLRAIPD